MREKNKKTFITQDGHSLWGYYCFKLSLNEGERMRAKQRVAVTPVKCNIISRFHQIFLLSGCWLSVKKKIWLVSAQCGILSSWVFSWMGFPFCTQASRAPQVKQMTCSFMRMNVVQRLHCTVSYYYYIGFLWSCVPLASMGNLSFPLFPWNGEHGE